jgi:N-acetylmuramic acid 6-phosphate (MurNAc-6-P) etherase
MPTTETVNPRFVDIDSWSTCEAVEAMLEGQLSALAAIKTQVPHIAQASEAAAAQLIKGGRLIYVGAGTSGRIAVQDGVELGPPTAGLLRAWCSSWQAVWQRYRPARKGRQVEILKKRCSLQWD